MASRAEGSMEVSCIPSWLYATPFLPLTFARRNGAHSNRSCIGELGRAFDMAHVPATLLICDEAPVFACASRK
jgi:hypothetical protein